MGNGVFAWLQRSGPRAGRLRLLAAGLALAWSGAAAQAAAPSSPSPEAVDAAVLRTMERFSLPGIAVGVIVDGEVVYRGTHGELRAGSGEPVDAGSLFKIASLSKAMTTAVLARQVDAGLLAWDDPVRRHLPQFRMHDAWVTEHMQVRDLLIHNSGLGIGAGDLMLWPEPNAFDRDDIIAALAHLRPTHSFRSHYSYDNLLYVVAGEVAARVAGKPYAQLVHEEVFAPLGMQRCQAGAWSRDAVGNVAQPHMPQDGRNVVVREDGRQIPDTASMAAGGIRCGLDDMLAWMRAWLDPSAAPHWLSETQRRALWTLHQPMPISRRMREEDRTRMYGYGYGWRISDVDGEWMVAHTGTLMGMYASLVLLPDRRSGFVILINGQGGEARSVLGQVLTRAFTRGAQALDVDASADAAARARAQAAAGGATARATAPDTSARLPVSARDFAWTGTWRDPWFGDVSLCARGDAIGFRAHKSPRMSGRVMQVGGRYLVEWDDRSVDAEPWLDFSRPGRGPARLAMSHVDPDADSSYDYGDLALERVAGCGR